MPQNVSTLFRPVHEVKLRCTPTYLLTYDISAFIYPPQCSLSFVHLLCECMSVWKVRILNA